MMVATATVAVIGNGMVSTTPDGSPLTANGRVMQTRKAIGAVDGIRAAQDAAGSSTAVSDTQKL